MALVTLVRVLRVSREDAIERFFFRVLILEFAPRDRSQSEEFLFFRCCLCPDWFCYLCFWVLLLIFSLILPLLILTILMLLSFSFSYSYFFLLYSHWSYPSSSYSSLCFYSCCCFIPLTHYFPRLCSFFLFFLLGSFLACFF